MLAVLLKQSSDVDLSDVSPELAIAAAVATGLWLLLLLAFAVSTRTRSVEPGERTMDLGEEPPALVDYLVNACRSSDRAVAGTLLDLAARHMLTVEDREEDLVCGVGHEPATALLPYEEMLYDHVADLARGGPAPAGALTVGTTGQSLAWHKRFAGLVARDALTRGLAEDRWSAKAWAGERLAGFVAGLLVLAVAVQANLLEAGIIAVLFVAATAHQGLKKLFGDQRLTATGWATASRWLGVKAFLQEQGEGFHDLPAGAVVLWDRYMAYACTFGLARAALRSLPLGAEDDHKAWSDFGGAWHEVRVSYPRTRWIWGRTPLGVLFVGIIMLGLGLAGAYFALQLYDAGSSQTNAELTTWFENIALGFGAVALGVAFWGLTTVNLAFVDLRGKREVDGRVVRCRAFQRGGNNSGTDYFIAVDDASSQEIKAWLVPPGIYGAVSEGAVVKATISPRQAHVYGIVVTTPGPTIRSEAVEPAAAPSAGAPLQLLFGPTGGAAGSVPTLTAEDIAGVLGEPFAPKMSTAGYVNATSFVSASGKTSVTIIGLGGKLASFAQMFANRSSHTATIGGVRSLLQGNSLTLMQPDMSLTIQLQSTENEHVQASLEALGQLLAQRMASQSPAPA